MGLRVVDENGGRPSFSQFADTLAAAVSDLWIVQILLYILYVVATNDEIEMTPRYFVLVMFAFGFLVTDIILVVSSKKGQRIGDILAQNNPDQCTDKK